MASHESRPRPSASTDAQRPCGSAADYSVGGTCSRDSSTDRLTAKAKVEGSAVPAYGDLLGRITFGRTVHPQVTRGARDPAFDEAHEGRRGPELRIDDQLWLDKMDHFALRLERTLAGGEHVLDPLDVGPVGQEKEIVVPAPKHIDRCA